MTTQAVREAVATGPGNWALEVHDVWYSYDGRSYVLKGLDLRVGRGLLTMLLGRSGSGKTTLLRLAKGLLSPQRGTVAALGVGLGKDRHRIRDRIAYIPQNLGLVRSATALENTLVGALSRTNTLRSVVKVFPLETVGEAKDTLHSLGLGHKLDEKVYSLSGGERQRVAIARALMQRPLLILADEFVSQLDPVTAFEIMDMTREIAARGVSLLITTHEVDLVAAYGDRAVVLKDGRSAYEGKGSALSEQELLELMR
jgi:phosphonate transport system ATP-binding protein